MSQVEKSLAAVADESSTIDAEPYRSPTDRHLDIDSRASELRLWPPLHLQAYCIDHFFMECNIYHEQENAQHSKLIAHSRGLFLEKYYKNKYGWMKPETEPTRRQPDRRAKEKRQKQQHSVLDQSRPPDAPFKPARVEKAYVESPEGAMFRILSEFRQKLELDKTWEDYRKPLQNKIEEVESQLRDNMENSKSTPPAKCVFGDPSRLECRYCGFVKTVADNVPVTPRKLAPPVVMRGVNDPAGEGGDTKVEFRGTNFIIDICGGKKTMVVLVGFDGMLDLCANLKGEGDGEGKGEGEDVFHSPTSLAARFYSLLRNPEQRRAKRRKTRNRTK